MWINGFVWCFSFLLVHAEEVKEARAGKGHLGNQPFPQSNWSQSRCCDPTTYSCDGICVSAMLNLPVDLLRELKVSIELSQFTDLSQIPGAVVHDYHNCACCPNDRSFTIQSIPDGLNQDVSIACYLISFPIIPRSEMCCEWCFTLTLQCSCQQW